MPTKNSTIVVPSTSDLSLMEKLKAYKEETQAQVSALQTAISSVLDEVRAMRREAQRAAEVRGQILAWTQQLAGVQAPTPPEKEKVHQKQATSNLVIPVPISPPGEINPYNGIMKGIWKSYAAVSLTTQTINVAAVDYGLVNKPTNVENVAVDYVLIFDPGGGTSDVSEESQTDGRRVHSVIWKLSFGSASYARKVFDLSPVRDIGLGNALVDMYCKCGSVCYGNRVEYRTERRDVAVGTSLIDGKLFCSRRCEDVYLVNEEVNSRKERVIVINCEQNKETGGAEVATEWSGNAIGVCLGGLRLLLKIRECGVKPDLLNVTSLLFACEALGDKFENKVGDWQKQLNMVFVFTVWSGVIVVAPTMPLCLKLEVKFQLRGMKGYMTKWGYESIGDPALMVDYVCSCCYYFVYDISMLVVKAGLDVDGATLACGTGACAVVVAAVLEGCAEQNCTVDFPGGPLQIEWRNEEEIVKLVTVLCRNGEVSWAWDVLHNVRKMGGVVEATSCNTLLLALGRGNGFKRMSELMVKMAEINAKEELQEQDAAAKRSQFLKTIQWKGAVHHKQVLYPEKHCAYREMIMITMKLEDKFVFKGVGLS